MEERQRGNRAKLTGAVPQASKTSRPPGTSKQSVAPAAGTVRGTGGAFSDPKGAKADMRSRDCRKRTEGVGAGAKSPGSISRDPNVRQPSEPAHKSASQRSAYSYTYQNMLKAKRALSHAKRQCEREKEARAMARRKVRDCKTRMDLARDGIEENPGPFDVPLSTPLGSEYLGYMRRFAVIQDDCTSPSTPMLSYRPTTFDHINGVWTIEVIDEDDFLRFRPFSPIELLGNKYSRHADLWTKEIHAYKTLDVVCDEHRTNYFRLAAHVKYMFLEEALTHPEYFEDVMEGPFGIDVEGIVHHIRDPVLQKWAADSGLFQRDGMLTIALLMTGMDVLNPGPTCLQQLKSGDHPQDGFCNDSHGNKSCLMEKVFSCHFGKASHHTTDKFGNKKPCCNFQFQFAWSLTYKQQFYSYHALEYLCPHKQRQVNNSLSPVQSVKHKLSVLWPSSSGYKALIEAETSQPPQKCNNSKKKKREKSWRVPLCWTRARRRWKSPRALNLLSYMGQLTHSREKTCQGRRRRAHLRPLKASLPVLPCLRQLVP